MRRDATSRACEASGPTFSTALTVCVRTWSSRSRGMASSRRRFLMLRATTTSLSVGSNAQFPSDQPSTVTGAAEMLRRLLAQVRTGNPGGAGTTVTDPTSAKRCRRRVALVAETLIATLRTNRGSIRIRLFPEQAPVTVRNFVELAEGTREWLDPRTGRRTRDRLYDGTIF